MSALAFDFIEFDGPFFVGISIDRTEGALEVTNQVGGTNCGHPTAHGLLVPLPASWTPKRDLLRDWYLTKYDPKRVTKWLAAAKLEHLFRALDPAEVPVSPDPSTTPCALAEAWVPVRVRAAKNLPREFRAGGQLLRPFAGERMILTYDNSD